MKEIFRIFLITFIFSIIYSINGICQKVIHYPDFLSVGYGGERPLYVIFHDTITLKSDTLWLRDINPFNELKFSKTGVNEQGHTKYSLSRSDVEQLIPTSNRAIYDQERRVIPTNKTSFIGESLNSIYYESKIITAIGFTFRIIDEAGYIWGLLGAVKIYNNNAECIFQIHNLNVNINQIAATDNGKYFSFNYGDIDEKGQVVLDGFRIYNIPDKRLLLDQICTRAGSPLIFDSLLVNGYLELSKNTSESCEVYYVLNSINGVLYSKKFSVNELTDLKKISSEGFIFISKSGVKRIDRFDSFKKEILK